MRRKRKLLVATLMGITQPYAPGEFIGYFIRVGSTLNNRIDQVLPLFLSNPVLQTLSERMLNQGQHFTAHLALSALGKLAAFTEEGAVPRQRVNQFGDALTLSCRSLQN